MQFRLLDVLGSLKMSYNSLSEVTTQAQHERRRLPGYAWHKDPKAGFNMVKMTGVRKILSRVSVEIVPETVGLICDIASCRSCLPLNLSLFCRGSHPAEHRSYTSTYAAFLSFALKSSLHYIIRIDAFSVFHSARVKSEKTQKICVNTCIRSLKDLRMNRKTTARPSLVRGTAHCALDKNFQLFEDEASKVGSRLNLIPRSERGLLGQLKIILLGTSNFRH